MINIAAIFIAAISPYRRPGTRNDTNVNEFMRALQRVELWRLWRIRSCIVGFILFGVSHTLKARIRIGAIASCTVLVLVLARIMEENG